MTEERKAALMFKALSDENRITILKMLASGEKCACILLEDMNITQPTLSHHMKILCDSGLVRARKDGKWMHYSIDEQGFESAKSILNNLMEVSPDNKQEKCC